MRERDEESVREEWAMREKGSLNMYAQKWVQEYVKEQISASVASPPKIDRNEIEDILQEATYSDSD